MYFTPPYIHNNNSPLCLDTLNTHSEHFGSTKGIHLARENGTGIAKTRQSKLSPTLYVLDHKLFLFNLSTSVKYIVYHYNQYSAKYCISIKKYVMNKQASNSSVLISIWQNTLH